MVELEGVVVHGMVDANIIAIAGDVMNGGDGKKGLSGPFTGGSSPSWINLKPVVGNSI